MEWVTSRICDLYDIGSGISITPDKYGSGYPFLTFKDVFNSPYIKQEIETLVESSENDRKNCSIKKGDVFLTRTSETAEELGMSTVALKDYEDATFNGFTKRLRPKDGTIAPLYAVYFFRSPYFRAQTYSMASLITRASLNNTNINHFKILHPKEIRDQERIGEILFAYDSLIETNSKRIKILEQMAENLYKEWFVRFRFPGHEEAEFEGGIPAGWRVSKAKDIFDIKIGRTPSRKEFEFFSNSKEENGSSWISISDMQKSVFIKKTSEYLTKEALDACNMPMVESDTILLSFKLTVGKVAITSEITCTNEAIAHFNTDDKFLREYTYLYLKNFNYEKLGNTSAIGTAINSSIVKNMPFLLPDRKTVKDFSDLAKPIFEEILKMQRQIEISEKQRNLLLPRLMSGKLEVK